MPTVSLISLGCAKNLVDSEIMVGHLRKAGMDVIPDAAKADAVIINTCSFLESAKEESINAILEASQTRERGRALRKRRKEQKLIVAGCMAQRYQKELPRALPEVDAFVGLDQITEIARVIEEVFARDGGRDRDGGRGDSGLRTPDSGWGDAGLSDGAGGAGGDWLEGEVARLSDGAGGARAEDTRSRHDKTAGIAAAAAGAPSALQFFSPSALSFIPDYDTPRFRLTPRHYAYIKIAEGCNHPCAFCVIPQIRGRHRSRTIGSVVAEARGLVADGVREINLISQDTTFFGMDTWEQRPNPRTPVDSRRGSALTTLLRELQAIPGDFWIRLLYTHPAHWSDELIATIAACDKIARYVDMPLQHISDRMLGAMRRETDSARIRDLVRRIRAGIPGIALRTTFIAGFPGETEADVDELCDFIRETKFERLGVFRYSREENTRAAKMDCQISAKQKDARWHRVMALQKQIAGEVSAAAVGRMMRVLVETPGIARGQADAPDIDGRIHVPKTLPAGEFAEVKITAHRDYDLIAG